MLYVDLLSLLTHYVTKIQLKVLGSGSVGQGARTVQAGRV